MSEHSLVDHGVKSYKIWKDPHRSWQHKLKDFVVEILIIIFAVLITLYFERVREHQKEKQVRTEFLEGYKDDLEKDIAEMRNDTSGYHSMQLAYIKLVDTKDMSEDSILFYLNRVGQMIEFTPNNSRFEALKAAGKVSAVDNAELITAMFGLYQKDIPYLKSFGTGSFNAYKENHILPFYAQVFKRDEHGRILNIKQAMLDNVMRNYMIYSIGKTVEILHRYKAVMLSYQRILSLVEAELKK